MKITADFILNQGSSLVNEDAVLVADNIFGVFDGATSINVYKDENGKTGGYLASQLVKTIFEHSDKGLITTAKQANQHLQKLMEEHNVDTTNPLNRWMTGVAVIFINKDSFDWVQSSDCLLLVINKDGSHRLLVEDYDHDESTLSLWKLYTETKDESYKEKFFKSRDKTRQLMNIDYGVLSGQKEAISFLNHGTENLEGVANIILFTDGLLIPKEDPRSKDDFNSFVKFYNEGGLENIKVHVRQMEVSDSEKVLYPRFKVHDDIGAISVNVE